MDEYTIKGGDGNEYGPVSEQVLRQWVSQGRANGQTLTRKAGGDFIPLSEQPELADALAKHSASPPLRIDRSVPSTGPIGLATPSPSASAYTPDYGMGSSNNNESLVISLIEPIAKASFWLKFMAVLQLIYAVIYILMSFGLALIFMWLPIWMGVLMWQVANRAKMAAATGDAATALAAQNKLKTIIIVMGVATLLSILLGLAAMIFFFAIGASNPDFLNNLRDQIDQGQSY